MRWHCANDFGRYCDSTPEWEKEPIQYKLADGTPTIQAGGRCKLTPETCGRSKTSQELWNIVEQEEKDRVSSSSYRHTLIMTEKSQEQVKVKGKTTKKPVKESIQGNLF